ncbi:hypothetical protein BCR34DRAFT_648244 [Clohesyomyces aquaticus]|uniref:Peptidase S26 domain-containing protein n=1 Tax=Clohesyomyces aquaticus TaxID=1231657 RepID=A0A1Y2A9I3_9PLEO|nr:hypothetical protein BCR34DRAFT_648244 [Clohesyomyces aquaticus]
MPPKPPRIGIITLPQRPPVARPAKPALPRKVPLIRVPPPAPPPTADPRLSRPALKYIRYAWPVLLGAASLLFIRDHLISLDPVNGSSMAPTLSPDAHETGRRDRVLVKHWGLTREYKDRRGVVHEAIKRGDVITFWKPRNAEEMGIKRVVAVQGDRVWPRRRTWEGRQEGEGEGAYVMEKSIFHEDGSVTVPYGHFGVGGWEGGGGCEGVEGYGVGDEREVEGKGEEGVKRSRVLVGESQIPPVLVE